MSLIQESAHSIFFTFVFLFFYSLFPFFFLFLNTFFLEYFFFPSSPFNFFFLLSPYISSFVNAKFVHSYYENELYNEKQIITHVSFEKLESTFQQYTINGTYELLKFEVLGLKILFQVTSIMSHADIGHVAPNFH